MDKKPKIDVNKRVTIFIGITKLKGVIIKLNANNVKPETTIFFTVLNIKFI